MDSDKWYTYRDRFACFVCALVIVLIAIGVLR
jgi:hypothetical protein